VPNRLAVAQIADRLAVLLDVGDDVELRMILEERLAIRVRPGRIEFAKLAAERKKFLGFRSSKGFCATPILLNYG